MGQKGWWHSGGDSVKKVRTLNGDIPIFVPTSDTTLTVEGAFADAKAVGDKFAETDDKIAQVKSDVAAEVSRATAAENTKADKTALARTDRSLDALWKLNKGVSYEFQKEEAVTYQKDIPTGAKLASVEKIGGRTLVWNQVLPETSYINSSVTDTKEHVELSIQCLNASDEYVTLLLVGITETGLKKWILKPTVDCTISRIKHNGAIMDFDFLYSNYAFKANHVYLFAIKFDGVNPTVLGGVSCSNFQLFDLTRMFGPDNGPSTVEEFEAMFPADYYPYNEGELLSMPVNEVVEQGKNLLNYDAWKETSIINGTATFENNGITITATQDDSYTEYNPNSNKPFPIDAQIKVNEGEIVTLSWEADNKDGGIYIFENGNGSEFVWANNNNAKKLSYTVPNGVTFITFRFGVAYKGNTISYKNIQIEKSSEPTSYEPYHSTTHAIPQSILQLDGYGDGVTADVYNYIDWENKKYHKRVGKVNLGTVNNFVLGKPLNDGSGNVFYFTGRESGFKENGKAISNKLIYSISPSGQWEDLKLNEMCIVTDYYVVVAHNASTLDEFKQAMSGVMLYYELAEEQITDISDLIGDTLQEPIEVETGGSLTFQNTHGDNYRVPVPNTVEYTVKLSEVAE